MATDVLFMRTAKGTGARPYYAVPHYNLDGKVRGAPIVVIGTFQIANLEHLRDKTVSCTFHTKIARFGHVRDKF